MTLSASTKKVFECVTFTSKSGFRGIVFRCQLANLQLFSYECLDELFFYNSCEDGHTDYFKFECFVTFSSASRLFGKTEGGLGLKCQYKQQNGIQGTVVVISTYSVVGVVTLVSASVGIEAKVNTTYKCASPTVITVATANVNFTDMRLEAYMPGNELSRNGRWMLKIFTFEWF